MGDFFTTEKLEELADRYLIPFGIDLVVAIIVFFVGRAAARAVVRGVDRVMTRSGVDESLRKFLGDVGYAILMVVVVIVTLERLGVQTTAAIAVLGAAGLAIGLALQGSLGNFASGVMIIIFRPYRVGDYVNVAGHGGTVEAVKVFNTVLLTPDNRELIIPNGQITSDSIENVTARATRRIDLVIGVSYEDDLAKTRDILREVVTADERVLAEPAPQVEVAELADSSVNFVVRPWVATSDYWAVRFSLLAEIKQRLDAEGITIPYPQRDVHVHQSAA